MARPRAKKKKVSSGTHTRSVFLYGSPNAEKRSTLEKLQADYTDAVNFYISLLSDREECLLQLLQNDKKDPLLRKLEKVIFRRGAGIAQHCRMISHRQEFQCHGLRLSVGGSCIAASRAQQDQRSVVNGHCLRILLNIGN